MNTIYELLQSSDLYSTSQKRRGTFWLQETITLEPKLKVPDFLRKKTVRLSGKRTEKFQSKSTYGCVVSN